MAITIVKNGKIVTLSPAQVGREIRRSLGISRTEYNRQYDVIRKRVRNFNRATGANLSAQELFYRSSQRQGAGLDATPLQKAVLSFTSSNTGSDLSRNALQAARVGVLANYADLIAKNDFVGDTVGEYLKLNPDATAKELNVLLTDLARANYDYKKELYKNNRKLYKALYSY